MRCKNDRIHLDCAGGDFTDSGYCLEHRADIMPETIKIGAESYQHLTRHAARIGMHRAEMARRAISMYTTVIEQPSFWRMVQKLNGRRLADVMVELLGKWATGEIVLAGDPGAPE